MKLIRTQLDHETPYSFSCGRCLRCCYGKSIQINPYEAARLSRNLGISTTAFARRFAGSQGTILAWKNDGSCVFLGPHGCSVHSDRPLVCRLYPLGRHVSGSGEETFSELEGQQGCEGLRGEEGTIRTYLAGQDAQPFIQAADRYLELLWDLAAAASRTAEDPRRRGAILKTVRGFRGVRVRDAGSWMDMDPAVKRFCKETGAPLPGGPGEKMALHIQAIRQWSGIKGGNDHEEVKEPKVRKAATGKRQRAKAGDHGCGGRGVPRRVAGG